MVAVDPHRGDEVIKIAKKFAENFNMTSLIIGEGMGGGVIERSYITGESYNVSFAHFLPISLLVKFGIIGNLIPLIIVIHYIFISKHYLKIIQLVLFGFVASIFPAYLISSWAFWLCLGGAIGVSVLPKRFKTI